MKSFDNKVSMKFDYAKWQEQIELDRLKKSINEFTFYPCSKEINEQIDYIIKRDTERKYFDSIDKEIKYRYSVLNDFYFQLFETTGFDELKYIDIGKAIEDSNYLKNSGKIVSRNFLKLNPHLKDSRKMKRIVAAFISKEFTRIEGITKLYSEKKRGRNISKGKQLKENSKRLQIYKKVIETLKDNQNITVRGVCNIVINKSGLNEGLDNFYRDFLSFYKNNKDKYPDEYQLLEKRKRKKKKVSS